MRALNYNGATLAVDTMNQLVEYSKVLNVPPSFLIVKLEFEGTWGASEVAKLNSNWSGMSTQGFTGTETRPSGVVVTQGSARPKNEGGYYYKYADLADFMTDWTHLIRRGGIYKVADNQTFEGAIKGMFKVGGAKYDYAALGYEKYLERMVARRKAINEANQGALDELDQKFKGDDEVSTVKKVLDEARKWLGATKYSAKHKQIVDGYNSVSPRPVGYAVTYADDWCDAFVTVVSDRAGATSLIGRECGVERHKSIFKQKNIWLGLVRPRAGDIVTFHWGGQRNGFAHHIGFVESVSGDTITTIEGNTVIGGVSKVGRRTYAWNAGVIQGYARPKYGAATTTAEAKAKNEKKVSQHFVVTIDNLRAFAEPHATTQIVENIKKDFVKNIDMTIESEGYLWGGWISSADGKRRYTTLQTLDGKRKFVDLKDGTIPHGGKTYTEYLALQDKEAERQPVGGDEPKIGKGQLVVDGVVYDVELKETK